MKRGAKRQTTSHSWQTGTRGSRGQRWGLSGWRVQLRAMRSTWSHPRVTPRVCASTRSHPEHIWAWFRHGSRVWCRGRPAAVSLVCLSFINLIPTSLWPPRWTRDWQARKAMLGPEPSAECEEEGAWRENEESFDWLISLCSLLMIYKVDHMMWVQIIWCYNNNNVKW